jgi:hypothetical protein
MAKLSAAYRFGSQPTAAERAVPPPPELVEQVAELQRLVRDQGAEIVAQAARIAALEGRPADDEDGAARPAGRWMRMKAAARATGRSVSGLKKLCRQGRVVFDDDAPRRLIDVGTVPRKVSKVPEVPA